MNCVVKWFAPKRVVQKCMHTSILPDSATQVKPPLPSPSSRLSFVSLLLSFSHITLRSHGVNLEQVRTPSTPFSTHAVSVGRIRVSSSTCISSLPSSPISPYMHTSTILSSPSSILSPTSLLEPTSTNLWTTSLHSSNTLSSQMDSINKLTISPVVSRTSLSGSTSTILLTTSPPLS